MFTKINNLLHINRRRAIVREYRAKRKEMQRVYDRHNELHPDRYGLGWQFNEYQETWETVCRLRDELHGLALEFGKYNLRISF